MEPARSRLNKKAMAFLALAPFVIASCDTGGYGEYGRQVPTCPAEEEGEIKPAAAADAGGEAVLKEENDVSKENNAEALARIWLDYWNQGRPDDIPLAEDFRHTSPFGCVQGREKYLAWVKPLAEENFVRTKVKRIISTPNQAVIHFEMESRKATIQTVDWVVVEDGKIKEVHSFYDATELR